MCRQLHATEEKSLAARTQLQLLYRLHGRTDGRTDDRRTDGWTDDRRTDTRDCRTSVRLNWNGAH